MRSTFLVLTLACTNLLYSQTLTEINFSYRVADWDGHLSGRFDAVASSSDGALVFAASHPGGIFRSTDGGANFTHLKNFPASGTVCIKYIERSTPVLIAAVEDWWLQNDRRSFAWYSTDRGNTWIKCRMAAAPFSYGVPTREGTQGYDIDYNAASDIIYLATDAGLLQSTDGGANFIYRETATTMPSIYRGNPTISSVECGAGNKVYMAGASGFYYSPDGGINWERAALPATAVSSTVRAKNQVSVVPSTETVLLLTMKNYSASSPGAEEYLSFTTTNGRTWTSIPTTPAGDGGCGGRPSVRSKRKITPGMADSCVLYISNRCNFFRKSFRINTSGTVDFTNPAAWSMLNHYHADTHELVFSNESSGRDNPLYMATDGGLHKLRSGIDYPLISGPHRGLNALLLYDIAGHTTRSSGGTYNHTIFFGTQDNLLGYWEDRLPPYTATPVVYWEGRGLETGLYGGNITYTAGSPYGNYQSGPNFRDMHGFLNCPGNSFWPFYIKDQCYIQMGTPPGSAAGTVGLYLTRNNGRKWWLIWSKAGDQPRIPKVIRTADNTAVIFMPVLDESGNQVFTKVVTDLTYFPFWGEDIFPPLVWALMPSFNNFEGLGSQQWETPVFAVNPVNTDHIIAPDMGSNTLKQSLDGGNNWTAISGLPNTTLLADGQYKFRNEYKSSFITSLGFSSSGQIIVAGTAMNGIFYSRDRGVSWARVEGSESLRHIYRPYFKPVIGRDEQEEVFFPTHGRGLWRVQFPRRPLYYLPDQFPYWNYLLRQPRDIGFITNSSPMTAFESKAARADDIIFFHPDSVLSVNNSPNGIQVLLAANSQVYSAVSGFVPLNPQELTAIGYSKRNPQQNISVNKGSSAEKISGLMIANKKIIALAVAKELPPFFATTKETGTRMSQKMAAFDEKKMNNYKDRFLVTELSTPKGRRYQLTACNIDTRNGTRSSLVVYVDNTEWTSFVIVKPGGCTTVQLPASNLPPGRYKVLIKPKGSQETVGTAFVEIRPADKK